MPSPQLESYIKSTILKAEKQLGNTEIQLLLVPNPLNSNDEDEIEIYLRLPDQPRSRLAITTVGVLRSLECPETLIYHLFFDDVRKI